MKREHFSISQGGDGAAFRGQNRNNGKWWATGGCSVCILSGKEASFARVASLCGVRVPAVWTVNPVSPFEGQRFLQNERHVHLLLCGSWLAAARSSPWTRSELNLRLGAKAGEQRDASHTGRPGWPGHPSACISSSSSWVFRKSNYSRLSGYFPLLLSKAFSELLSLSPRQPLGKQVPAPPCLFAAQATLALNSGSC